MEGILTQIPHLHLLRLFWHHKTHLWDLKIPRTKIDCLASSVCGSKYTFCIWRGRFLFMNTHNKTNLLNCHNIWYPHPPSFFLCLWSCHNTAYISNPSIKQQSIFLGTKQSTTESINQSHCDCTISPQMGHFAAKWAFSLAKHHFCQCKNQSR